MHDKKNITEWEKIKKYEKAREAEEKNKGAPPLTAKLVVAGEEIEGTNIFMPNYLDAVSSGNENDAKLKEWREFSKSMEEHIIKSGKKYDMEGQSCVDIDPWISCISAGRKYLWEIVAWFQNEDWDASKVRENLLKTAHYCQLAYTKLLGGD